MTRTPPICREIASNVLRFVAERYLITTDELRGKCRKDALVWARHTGFALLRRRSWTLEAIGRAFLKDHGAVFHGLRQHSARVHTDKRCRDDWESAIKAFEDAIPRSIKQTFEWKTEPQTERKEG